MPDDPSRWQSVVVEAERELRRWRAAHPDATLTEIERELDARLRAARAGWLADLAGDLPAAAADRCPDCGGPLVRRGEHARTVRTQGDRPLPRSYASCPACGAGLFPPR